MRLNDAYFSGMNAGNALPGTVLSSRIVTLIQLRLKIPVETASTSEFTQITSEFVRFFSPFVDVKK